MLIKNDSLLKLLLLRDDPHSPVGENERTTKSRACACMFLRALEFVRLFE